MNVESYGQSRPQEGRQHTQNQDAYVIRQGPVPWVAICDGAGNAQSAARRALSLLESWLVRPRSVSFCASRRGCAGRRAWTPP